MPSPRLAIITFAFFFLKGLAWLLVPAAVYLWAP